MQGLVDNKKEYIKTIQDAISIPIAEKINEFYNISTSEKTGLKGFQKQLSVIKNWNNLTIDKEYKNIISNSKYKKLDKIYKLTIVTNIKIKIYEHKDNIDNIQIKYPSFKDYIHICYVNVSDWVWKNPFLFFRNNLRQSEIQNNYNIIEKNIKKIIKNTIRECTPINDIIEQIEDDYQDNIIKQFVDKDKEKKNRNKEINTVNDNNNGIKSVITRNLNKINTY